MRSLLNIYQAWKKRRLKKRLKRWERTRAMGKTRLVLSNVILFTVLNALFTLLFDYYYGKRIDTWELLSSLNYGYIYGLFLSLTIWWSGERIYQKSMKANQEEETQVPLSEEAKHNRHWTGRESN